MFAFSCSYINSSGMMSQAVNGFCIINQAEELNHGAHGLHWGKDLAWRSPWFTLFVSYFNGSLFLFRGYSFILFTVKSRHD